MTLRSVLLAGLCLTASAAAFAQSPQLEDVVGLGGSTTTYRDVTVLEGDTPLVISRREFGSSAFARPLAELNDVDTNALLQTGSVFQVPVQVPALLQTARVAFVKGDVTRSGTLLSGDDLIGIGDVVITGMDGFLSIEFNTGSVVNLQPNTEATISELSCLESDANCVIEIDTLRGELSSDVSAREGQPMEFRISTPFASAAVRGTSFRTQVDSGALRAAVTEGDIDVEALGEVVQIPTEFGSVTEEGSAPGEPFPLLRSPVFRNVPTRVAAGDAVTWFDLPEAVAYSARVSLDEAGVQAVAEPPAEDTRLDITSELQSGDYFITLRGVDSNEVAGLHSTVRLVVADIDPDIPPVATDIRREGSEYLIQVIDVPEDAPGFEIQVSRSEDFSDPLSLDVTNTGQAVLDYDTDILFARARTLVDPLTVSEFGPATSSAP